MKRGANLSILSLVVMGFVITLTIVRQPVEGYPIVNGQLNPWQISPKGSISFLRDPMPWEDGYFDPSYHAWPKSRQQVGDKQTVKLTSDESVEGVSKQNLKGS